MDDAISLLTYDASWLDELTLHQRFAFGMVAVCCSLIPVSERLDWTLSYDQVIEKLGSIYSSYCKAKGRMLMALNVIVYVYLGISESNYLIKSIPNDVIGNSCDDVRAYFQWVVDVQNVFNRWKTSFSNKSLNYDDIQHYNHFYVNLHNVCTALSAASLLVDPHDGEGSRSEYLKLFEKLNIHLIKYIPGQPSAGWYDV